MLSYLMTLMIQRIQLIELTVSRSKWKVENPRFPGIGAEVNVYGSMGIVAFQKDFFLVILSKILSIFNYPGLLN